MPEVLSSSIRTSSAEFQENKAHHEALAAEVRAAVERVRQGGGESSVARHRDRGKLLPRERIDRILDAVALPRALAARRARHVRRRRAGAGIVTGIGVVAGREVMVVANDATVKGGTYYPMTVKKHLRAQEVALENRLPCIYLVDSGGAFLPLQDEVFPDRDHFGRIFYNQARMSAAGIPQIARCWASAPPAAPTCRR
jgi:3-methylcrotonyl-CoA carboxylase beta subunit